MEERELLAEPADLGDQRGGRLLGLGLNLAEHALRDGLHGSRDLLAHESRAPRVGGQQRPLVGRGGLALHVALLLEAHLADGTVLH